MSKDVSIFRSLEEIREIEGTVEEITKSKIRAHEYLYNLCNDHMMNMFIQDSMFEAAIYGKSIVEEMNTITLDPNEYTITGADFSNGNGDCSVVTHCKSLPDGGLEMIDFTEIENHIKHNLRGFSKQHNQDMYNLYSMPDFYDPETNMMYDFKTDLEKINRVPKPDYNLLRLAHTSTPEPYHQPPASVRAKQLTKRAKAKANRKRHR